MAAPPRVAARIETAPDGPLTVLHATGDLVHLDLPGGAVGVAAAGAPGLPHALRTNLATLSARVSSRDLPTAYVESGTLYLGGRALVARRLVDVRAPRLDAVGIPTASPVVALGTPRPRDAGLVPPSLDERIDGPVDAETVSRLVGWGDGLTPLGDDVLCGWLAAHRAAGVETPAVDDAVLRALPRTTRLSATLLECALAGEAADLALVYLRILGTLGITAAATARAALARLGHSSGGGLAVGIDLALAELAGQVAA